MQEADATRCITVLVMSNRPHLSKAEAAAGLRYVPWRDRHRRHMQHPSTVALPSLKMRPQELPQPGFFDEVELELVNDKPANARERSRLVVPGRQEREARERTSILRSFVLARTGTD